MTLTWWTGGFVTHFVMIPGCVYIELELAFVGTQNLTMWTTSSMSSTTKNAAFKLLIATKNVIQL